ncbi:ankyrin repeat-containing protein At5g02620-like [Ziziphus jujuba]|uniref:Ankyrin repeat-containing protein At5g02620-like n=1 Tax=Ziziphus jujuba TaxID=326968 RepID=A0ABM4AFP5_ZIZJJ|nr:ankyrin repeat-containing protein At5g02620-like [Ziziphus jujuba]
MDPELYKAAIDGTLSEKTLRAAADSKQLVTGGKKNNILHVAAKSGNLQINTEEEAKSGHVEMVRFLIVKARKMDAQQKRKLVTMKNCEGDTALHEAVRHNRFEIVKLLIHEDSNLASVLNGYGESPLFMAVARCFYEIGLLILNAAAPINCSVDGRNSMNVLHAAVIRAPIPKFIHEVLFKLSSSSMLEKADDFRWIPLHYAAYLDNRELIELFIDHNNSLA